MAKKRPNANIPKGKRNPRDKRQNSKPQYDRKPSEREMTDSDTMRKSDYSNDPRWWSRTGQIAINATNISTYTPIGIPMDLQFVNDFTPTGILKLEYQPCFGDINSPTHPINVVARDLYDFINARNSRSSSYDPNDLMLYIIGVANAWVFHAWVRRVVGMYNTYSMLNRYWWDPVLASMGVAPISSTSTITDWVDLANYMAMTLNTLAVPDGIDYFKRAQMLPETVYADSVSDKASLYYYSPRRLLKYEYDEEGKGKLNSVITPWSSSSIGPSNRIVTPDRVKAAFDVFVSNLINDTDITLMKADIRKAFGEDKCYHLPQLDRNFVHGYIYDGFVNLQTRNACVFDFLYGYSYDITQDMQTNTLTTPRIATWINEHPEVKDFPGISYVYTGLLGDQLFDFPVDEVNNDLWQEATKLHPFFGNGTRFYCTTEFICKDYMYIFEENQLVQYENCINVHFVTSDHDPFSLSGNLQKLELASKFAASPLQWIFVSPDTTIPGSIEEIYLNDDLTNYTNVGVSSLKKINDSSHLSIFTWRDLS